MKIKNLSPDKLTPYEGNPRIIGDDAVAAVAASIKDGGFQVPIVVDSEGVIVMGHTRRLAAISLGMKTVPVVTITDRTDEQIQALRLNDNRSAEFSSWDQIALGIEVGDLATADFDLENLVFEDVELSRLLDGGEEFNPNLAPTTKGGMGVDGDALTKAGEGQNMGDRTKQVLTEVTCPECGGEFYLQPEDMKS